MKSKLLALLFFIVIAAAVWSNSASGQTLIGPKEPYPGESNVPDPDVILQGGDDCASATVISSVPYNDDGTTDGYTDDYDEACPYPAPGSPDVVYFFEPTADIAINISLCQGQTDYDTRLYIYEDECQLPGDGNQPYACNDDFCSDPYLFVSQLNCVELFTGHVYYIVVDGYGGDFGNYNIDITECIPPPDPCPDAVFHNGEPDGVNGIICDRRSDPDDLEAWCVADVEFTDRVRIDGLHWWAVTDDDYDWQETGDFIILEDAGDQPGIEIYEEFDVPNSRIDTGEMMFGRHVYIYTFEVDITLPTGAYWFGMRPVNQGNAGENHWLTCDQFSETPLYWRSEYFGFPDWEEGCTDWWECYDVAFCITGIVVCTYIPGDCNHNDVPLELADVVSMIGMYRGTAESQYTCPCPPHSDDFAPEADPNGNCVAFELSDVVTEIAAYRGTGEASGCADCPGTLRLLPSEDQPFIEPSLKTNDPKATSVRR